MTPIMDPDEDPAALWRLILIASIAGIALITAIVVAIKYL